MRSAHAVLYGPTGAMHGGTGQGGMAVVLEATHETVTLAALPNAGAPGDYLVRVPIDPRLTRNDLIGLLRIDAQREDQLDRLVELGRLKALEHIKRLIDINCYRGKRHRVNLPVHGQRTRTNARTRKGPKKSRSGMSKPAPASK